MEYLECQKKDCNEQGKYWYPWDGIIYNLCEIHWKELNHKLGRDKKV